MNIENRLRAYADSQKRMEKPAGRKKAVRRREVTDKKGSRMGKNCWKEKNRRTEIDCENVRNLLETIEKSKKAFWEGQAAGETSWLEFLYQQTAYIQKRWWLAQALVLAVLWFSLYMSGSGLDERRCMGILTPCFVILLLPELWKNQSSNAVEVESAAYFSLQKIYAARMILFGMVDTCLLSLFFLVSVFTVRMAVLDFLIQFVLPLNVTCCICFQTLQSKRNFSIYSSLTLCMGWIAVWVSLVLQDEIYERITVPVWMGTLAGSFFFLCYSIVRVWNIRKGRILWN